MSASRGGKTATRRPAAHSQRGGFGMGVVVGLLIGLALALGVALYIAKVPVPFVDKLPHRSAEQEAAEAERLKNWDPNAPLAGKQAPRPNMSPPSAAAPVVPPADTVAAPPAAASAVARAASKPAPAASGTATAPSPAASAKPPRDPAAILAGKPGADASFIYFVQVGAYSNADDAEQQRAKLALQGVTAKLSEREQSGRVVHRVRLGPFDSREEAESQQERVRGLGSEASLVRVERPPR
jgi:cell division protein FtsN